MIWDTTSLLGRQEHSSLTARVPKMLCVPVGSQTSWQIASLSAAEAVAQLCSRKMTALQYAEAVLEIAETYTCLNAFSFLEREKVAAAFIMGLRLQRACMHAHA